ncbi:hypothetical protein GCM10025866_32280 [Naasia aerilata]|uniref:DUF559 domain-containing protein n=2 Tax=Naasia aerilata TaxID=1162966 RepID=A0ABM8GGQ6_9MICO|nr:hypothetical protein GCM10025866_32280 [Naasia aerilata]
MMRSPHWDASVWGVRAAGTAVSLEARCRLYAARLPDAFFSHRTAAALLGLPLPPGPDDVLDMSVAAPDRAPHAKGLSGHSLVLEENDLVVVDGLRVTRPARTWFDLGKELAVPDLVVAGDRILSRAAPLGTRADLAAMVEDHPGERGVRRLATALALIREGTESPQESRLRTILMQGGLPEPAVNLDIHDERGRFLGRGDLVYVAERLVIEYQGDYHRDKAQWRRDMSRRAALEAAGWRVLELNADDLRDPALLVARVRDLLLR